MATRETPRSEQKASGSTCGKVVGWVGLSGWGCQGWLWPALSGRGHPNLAHDSSRKEKIRRAHIQSAMTYRCPCAPGRGRPPTRCGPSRCRRSCSEPFEPGARSRGHPSGPERWAKRSGCPPPATSGTCVYGCGLADHLLDMIEAKLKPSLRRRPSSWAEAERLGFHVIAPGWVRRGRWLRRR
jgi:hypothetical protein